MNPIISAFKASPDRGRGLARDMRIRWAFEEAGLEYDVKLVTFEEMKKPPYLALQPFGQIPYYQEGELTMFETGAILLHLAEQRPGLLPTETNARARAISWLFAALNTVEPPILDRSITFLFEREKPWYKERMPAVEERVSVLLKQLAAHLGDEEWLDGAFSIADLMMVTVLRRLEGSGLLEKEPLIMAYIQRAEVRPAYQRAFAAQKAVFEDSQKR